MASYDKYDPKLETLVVETKTIWDDTVSELSDTDRTFLARTLHQSPQLASKVHYERAHTGFTREITVTMSDLERLYDET